MSLETDVHGKLLRRLLKAKGFAQPIIDSYNNVIEQSLPKIIESFDVTVPSSSGTGGSDIIKFSNLRYQLPTITDLQSNGVPRPLFPMEARRKNLPYLADMKVDATRYTNINGKLIPVPDEVIKDVYIGQIPVMIHSRLDRLTPLSPQQRMDKGEGAIDPGGYFQIKSQEKLLLLIERLRTLYPYLYPDKDEYSVRYTSQTLTESKLVYVYEKKNTINVRFTTMKEVPPLNIYYIFYALGITTDIFGSVRKLFHRFIVDEDCERLKRRRKEFDNYIRITENGFATAERDMDTKSIMKVILETMTDSSADLSSSQYQDIPSIVQRELFVNISIVDATRQLDNLKVQIQAERLVLQQRLALGQISPADVNASEMQFAEQVAVLKEELRKIITAKASLLAMMVVKYVEFKTGYRVADDRDSWANKRLVDAGGHMETRFIDIWKDLVQDIEKEFKNKKIKSIRNISIAIKSNMMRKNFIDAFVRGIWGGNRTKVRDFTVVDPMSRDNPLSSFAHLRRISTPTHRQAALRDKRLIHNTSFGAICPSNTPEGSACGLNKDSGLTTYVSLTRSSEGVYKKLGQIYLPWSVAKNIIAGKLNEANIKFLKEFYGPSSDGIPFNNLTPQLIASLLQGRITSSPIFASGCEIDGTEKNVFNAPAAMNSIYVNGRHFGYGNGRLIRDYMAKARRELDGISFDTGVIIDIMNDLWIYTNAGRLLRPLLIVDPVTQDLVIDMKNLREKPLSVLMKEGAMEYIDIAEQQTVNIYIAETYAKLIETKNSLSTAQTDLNIALASFNTSVQDLYNKGYRFTPTKEGLKQLRKELKGNLQPSASLNSIQNFNFNQNSVTGSALGDNLSPVQNIPSSSVGSSALTNRNAAVIPGAVGARPQSAPPTGYPAVRPQWKALIALLGEIERLNYEVGQSLQRMKFTHCEVDSSEILGISASIMPFPETNPAPRVTYQCGMGKQALTQDSSGVRLLFRVTDRILNEPDVPLIATDAHETLGLDEFPAGKNIIIAIAPLRGQNQEDAIIENRTSQDMGLFYLTIYTSYTTTVEQSTQTKEYIGMPDRQNATKDYSKLDPATFIARKGIYVNPGDCLIAKKVLVTKIVDGVKTTDSIDGSVYVDIGKEGYVDEVFVKENAENFKLIRVRLREPRKYGIGDKAASRYSQKGICSDLKPETDMPTVVSDNPLIDGVVPDIVFSPLGLPSRQTVGKIIEILAALIAMITGVRYNATAFRKHDLEGMCDELEANGFSRNAKVKLRDGITGNLIETDVFVGPVYYQILRHLVKDKMQARGYGEVQFLTRQPISGIRRKGGLRLGEMERDALIAYGASHLLNERTMKSSDAYKMIVCRGCGQNARSNAETGEIRCNVCVRNDFRMVEVPFSFKLLTQYLSGANIKVSIRTGK